MECWDFTTTLPNNTINLSVIYRPPDKSVLSFADDFLNYMEGIINLAGKNLFIGGFNVHVKDQSNSDTRHFQDVLDSFGLINYIGLDAHCLENTLGLVITSARENFIRNPYQGHLLSNHNIVFFEITSKMAKTGQCEVSFRKLKHMNIQAFHNNIPSHLSWVDFYKVFTRCMYGSL